MLANLFHIVFFILDHLSIEHWMLTLHWSKPVKTRRRRRRSSGCTAPVGVNEFVAATRLRRILCTSSRTGLCCACSPKYLLHVRQVTSSDRAKLATWLVWNRTWVVWAYLHFPLDGRSARKVAANPRWIKSVFANWFEKGSTATPAVRLRDDLTLDWLLCNECARMHHFKNFRPMTCLETS